MPFVKNRDQLLSHGDRELRETALDIVEHALKTADPYTATKALVNLEGDTLHIGDLAFDLTTRDQKVERTL